MSTMDGKTTPKRYRQIIKYLRIGAKEYAVLDPLLAQERAHEHLSIALNLMAAKSGNDNAINKELVLATDFGCKDAPFILSQRILDVDVKTPFYDEEVAVFLKIAAEREHPEAAYQMGCSYAGMNKFPKIEKAGNEYFSSFDAHDRTRLAEYYLKRAAELNHQQAIEDLIIAYAYGRGYILKSIDGFVEVCEEQTARGNQAVMLGFAAWLSGMTVEGDEPLPEAIEIPKDLTRSLNILLSASRGTNLELGQHALHLICKGLANGTFKNVHKVSKLFEKEVETGNQLLSLYLAWYSIPTAQRSTMPKVLENYQLSQLAELVDISDEKAIAYLDKAVVGNDEDISALAKEILSQVFGRCFMDTDGLLVIEDDEFMRA